MRDFLCKHPIFGTCLFSCLSVILVGLVLTAGLIVLIFKTTPDGSKTSYNYKYLAGNQDSKNKFLSISIKGIILTDAEYTDPLSFFLPNYAYGYVIKNELVAAAADTSIKGVILEIDSPGGTITGANAISDGIAYYKQKTHKPVYAHISELGASGAYWVAASADKIIADTGSLTGSIGVILGPFKYYDKVLSEGDFSSNVATQNGITEFNITAGTDKDFGDPYQKLSDNARNVLQTGINNEYQLFVDHVSAFRKIPAATITDKLGALVYDNKQALANKLIDATGNKDDAYTSLAAVTGAKADNFQVVSSDQGGLLSSLIKGISFAKPLMQNQYCLVCGQMLFLYGNPSEYILKR